MLRLFVGLIPPTFGHIRVSSESNLRALPIGKNKHLHLSLGTLLAPVKSFWSHCQFWEEWRDNCIVREILSDDCVEERSLSRQLPRVNGGSSALMVLFGLPSSQKAASCSCTWPITSWPRSEPLPISKQSTFGRRHGRWQPLCGGARYVDSMLKVLWAGECGMAQSWSYWGIYWGQWGKLLHG